MAKRNGKIVIIGFIMLLLFSGFSTAQEAQGPVFLRETLQLLEQEGWPEQDIEAFRIAAQEMNWAESEGAEPEVVALALQLANQEREKLSGSENATLALELAKMTASMKRLGFENRELVRTTLDGTREVMNELAQLRNQIREGEEIGTGEQERIRETVRARIQSKLEEAVKSQNRAKSKIGSAKGAGQGRAESGDFSQYASPDGDGAGNNPGTDFRP